MDEKIANLIKIKDEFNEKMMEQFLKLYKTKLRKMTPKERRKKNQGGGSNSGLRQRITPSSELANVTAAPVAPTSRSSLRQDRQNLGLVLEEVQQQQQQQLNSMSSALNQLMVMYERGQNDTNAQLQAVSQTLSSIDQSTQDAVQERDNIKEQADKHYNNIMDGLKQIKEGIKDDEHCVEDTSKNGLLFGIVMSGLFNYYYKDSPKYSSNITDMSVYNHNQPYIHDNMKQTAVNTVVSGVAGGLMGYFYKCILLLLKIFKQILTFIVNTYISINLFIHYFAKLWSKSFDMVFLAGIVQLIALIFQVLVNMHLWILIFKMFGFDSIFLTISKDILSPIITTIYKYTNKIPEDITKSLVSLMKPIFDVLDGLVPDEACEGAPEIGKGRFMHCCIGFITSFIASMISTICCAAGNKYFNPLSFCCKPSEETPTPPPPPPQSSSWFGSSNGSEQQPSSSGWFGSSNGSEQQPSSSGWFGYGGSYKESNNSYNYVPKSNMEDEIFVRSVTIILNSKLINKNKINIDKIKNNIIKFLDLLVKLLGFLNFVSNVLVKAIKVREKQLKLAKSPSPTFSKKRMTYMRSKKRKPKMMSLRIKPKMMSKSKRRRNIRNSRIRPLRIRIKRRSNKK